MSAANYPKVVSFKTVHDFRNYLAQEKIPIGLEDHPGAALGEPCTILNGRTAGNRWAILPMEGWDCESDGSPSE